MAKYSYTYSGSNAAFVFAGIATLPTGIAVLLEADQHKALQKNKFAKHLIDAGELAIEEVAEVGDSKPASGRGKGNQAGNPLVIVHIFSRLVDLDCALNPTMLDQSP